MLAIVAPDGMPLPSGAGGVRYSISTVLVAIAIHISTPLDAGISTPVSAGVSAPVSAGISAPVAARRLSDRVVSPTAALGGTGMGARPSLGSV